MISFFVNFATIIILGIIQVSFLTTWPLPVRSLNLILSLAIFLIVVNRYRQGLWWAFGTGLFLELFSFEIFGLVVFSLLLTIIIINFLFNSFFTSYSFYSLTVLGLVGTLIYNLLILLGNLIVSFLGLATLIRVFNMAFFSNLVWQLVLNLLILYIIFFIFHFLIGKFKMDISRQITNPGT